MIPSDKIKDAEALESYRLMLKKAENHPDIAKALDGMGYTSEKLKEGIEVLRSTREIYDANSRKKDDLSIHYRAFSRKKKAVEQTHRMHRKKARILSRNDADMERRLAIKGPYPTKYFLWMENLRKFYSEAAGDPRLQEKLMQLRLTKKDIDQGLEDIATLEEMYARYKLLTGESKQSTVDKRKAFKHLHVWMIDFYAVARMALKKNPELLDALHSAN